jgi:hypothetical protein
MKSMLVFLLWQQSICNKPQFKQLASAVILHLNKHNRKVNKLHWIQLVSITDAHPKEVVKAECVQIAFIVDVENSEQVL